MKIFSILLMPCVLLFTGCDTKDPSRETTSQQITVEDLAWATDWKIYKWKVSDLTSEELRQIQVVVVGSEGEIVQEGVSVGYDSVLDPEMEIALALKKVGADVEIKLRGGGGSVSSTMESVLTGNTWASSANNGVYEGFVVIATNSNGAAMNSQSALSESGNKLCLRLQPYKSKKQNKADMATPRKPSD